MSVECALRRQCTAPMSTSGSSVASDSPESDAVSVLEFAERYAFGTGRQVSCVKPHPLPYRVQWSTQADVVFPVLQCNCPRSNAKRKRRRDVLSHEDERQLKPPYAQHQAFTTEQQTPCVAVSPSSTHGNSYCRTPGVTSYYMAIHSCLLQWCCSLKALQPKCIIANDVLHRSMDLFHRYRLVVQTKDLPSSRPGITAVHLAACLWVASKNDGNRACVPSRTLLTRAIAVCPEELTQAELVVCCTLQWNLFNSEVASVLHL